MSDEEKIGGFLAKIEKLVMPKGMKLVKHKDDSTGETAELFASFKINVCIAMMFIFLFLFLRRKYTAVYSSR